VHATLHDDLRIGAARLRLSVGGHATPLQVYPSLATRFEQQRLDAHLSLTGQPIPWLLERGFSTLVDPLDDAPAPTDVVARLAVGASDARGPFTVRLEAFGTAIQNPVDLYSTSPPEDAPGVTPDTFAVRAADGRFYRAGATLSGTWRASATRGLYATGSATAQRFLNPDASPLHARAARTLPEVHGTLRLGARFLLFKDLKTDLYVSARGWSSMNSRWFHPPTGLLAIPSRARPIPTRPGTRIAPGGTARASAEAILRGAKLYFTFENVLSSSLQPGTFVVPVYPLPARQFRFGVHWPIFN
jgi:hypothetical protein